LTLTVADCGWECDGPCYGVVIEVELDELAAASVVCEHVGFRIYSTTSVDSPETVQRVHNHSLNTDEVVIIVG